MVCVKDNLFKKTVFQLLHITQKGAVALSN